MTPLHVFADDLTGAAEIAGTAHRYGLKSTVRLSPSPAVDGEITVWDLNTRLLDADAAARVARDFVRESGLREAGQLFFKVDSVLRGPICAQLEAIGEHLPSRRMLLAPANPSRGRVVSGGVYLINGVSLDQTPFAHDPHHPAFSAYPTELLANHGTLPVVLRRPHEVWPPHEITLAETATVADVERWAQRLNKGTLAAGAADFFTAILKRRGARVRVSENSFQPEGPTLWVCGSTASPSRPGFDGVWSDLVHYLPSNSDLIGTCNRQIQATLREQDGAILTTRLDTPGDSDAIEDMLAAITRELVASDAARHLLIEGGATAARIIRGLGFDALETVHEWQPGVVSFSPGGRSDLLFTLKPGSYSWPEAVFPAAPLQLERR